MTIGLTPFPVADELDVEGKVARWRVPSLEWFRKVYIVVNDMQNSGTTAQRPASDMYVGKPYFDSTLGLPIWWNGSAWIDAAGGGV